jgi:xanthine dehydrogenase accessory factor
MLSLLEQLAGACALAPHVLVRVAQAQGSVPREVGAWMAVGRTSVVGTIGGGQLEWQAIEQARALLAGMAGPGLHRYPLGPSLGQCCGGVVHLAFEALPQGARWPADALAALAQGRAFEVPSALKPTLVLQPPSWHVSLFGGGHVGRAIVQLLGGLPCRVLWQDSRDAVFPQALPLNVQTEYSSPVQRGVADVPAGSQVLVMSFSHAEDLEIVAACLARQRAQGDLPFIGLIGSRTKWATFRARLRERGYGEAELDHITCPIGLAGVGGKEPEVIALAVVAQLRSR